MNERIKQLNKDFVIASYVLTYGDLFKYLLKTKYIEIGNKAYCDLYCSIRNKYDYFSIMKILKYEKCFVNSTIRDRRIILRFSVYDKYINMLSYISDDNFDWCTKNKVFSVITKANKKSPATQKSSRAAFVFQKSPL